jgi:alpha-glucoside transport system permease protein
MATIRKDVKPDGTVSSATSIIAGRTFGNVIVQAALVVLALMWTIPTGGLLVSSFRTPNAIRETGWWTIMTGAQTINSSLSFNVAADGDDDAITPGDTFTVTAEESVLLDEVVEGFPAPSVGGFEIETITGQATVESLGDPITLPNIGTVTVNDAIAVELDGEGDYELFAMNDLSNITVEDFPFTLEYDIRAVLEEEIDGTLTIDTFGQSVEIEGIGTVVVRQNSSFDFTPADSFNGIFEPDLDQGESIELPYELDYEIITGSVETITGEATIEALDEPVAIDEFGTITLIPSADVAFEPAEGYTGFFIADIDETEETPFTFEYELTGIRNVAQDLTIDRVNIAQTVPQIGQVVVFEDGNYAFAPRGNFAGEFIPTLPDAADIPADAPFTISYEATRSGGTLIEANAGDPTEIAGVGTLTMSSDGSYEFTAAEDFNGEVDLRYQIVEPIFTLNNYDFVLFSDGMGSAFLNSLTITIPATIVPISIAAFAAYAFSWMDFPGRRILFIIVVGLQVVPLHLALIPMLRIYTGLGINGTFLALWLAHTGFGMPLAVFLLRNYIGNLPRELIESASIDGASHFTIFVRLILPLSVPALAAFAIFQFLWVWNDLIVALVFLGDRSVVTSRLSEMVGSRGQDWHVLTAGAFVSMSLPLIVFLGLQRYFVRGLLAGSVKGG